MKSDLATLIGSIVAGTQTGASTAAAITSSPLDIRNINNLVIFANYTGTPVGTLKVQTSPDNVQWQDLPSGSQSISAAGSWRLALVDVPDAWLRLVWTPTGTPTGQLFANAFTKGI